VTLAGYPLGGSFEMVSGVVTENVARHGRPTIGTNIDGEAGTSGGPILDSRGGVLAVLSGLVVSANLTDDGRSHIGGLDLRRWWGKSARIDLCRTYPQGGVADCESGAAGPTTRVPVRLRGG
jgi:hypothetical protein